MSAYTDLKLSDGPCELPREPVKLVTVSTPWVEFRAEQSNTTRSPPPWTTRRRLPGHRL